MAFHNQAELAEALRAIRAGEPAPAWAATATEHPTTAPKPGTTQPPAPAGAGKARARPRPAAGMNKTESAFAAHLELRRQAGDIIHWQYEPLSLRLAKATFYKPDFVVIAADGGIEFAEVKGYWEDDARVKIKTAAAIHWWATFAAYQWKQKRWHREEF